MVEKNNTPLFILLIALAGYFSSPISTSALPSLYYYSITDKAFVLEDVAGRERHIWVSFSIPEECYSGDYCSVDGPGWSPSGRWFAWTVSNNKRVTESASVHLMDSGGELRLDYPEITRVNSLQWSRTDHLLITRFTDDGQAVLVWSPHSHTLQPITETKGYTAAKWGTDNSIWVYNTPSTADGDGQTTLSRFNLDGTPIGTMQPSAPFAGLWVCVPNISIGAYGLSIDQERRLTLRHRDTTTVLFTPPIEVYLYAVDFYPLSQTADIYLATACHPQAEMTRVRLNISRQSITTLEDDVTYPLESCSRCDDVSWRQILPSQHPVQTQPTHTVIWSPNRQALFSVVNMGVGQDLYVSSTDGLIHRRLEGFSFIERNASIGWFPDF